MDENKKTVTFHASKEVQSWLKYLKQKWYINTNSLTIVQSIKKAYETEIRNEELNSIH